MEKTNDDGLPQPGTDEPQEASDGEAGKGPGNVSVDEPTAAALGDDVGSPGGEESDSSEDDSESADDDSDSTSGDEDPSDT